MTIRRYALLEGTDVVNVILLDTADEYEPDEGLNLKLAPVPVSPGWTYVNKKWEAPVRPEPEVPDSEG